MMIVKSGLIVFAFLLIIKFDSFAQGHHSQYWIRYYNELTVKHWQINSEIDNKKILKPHQQYQLLIRSTLLYKLKENIKVGLGVAYSERLPTGFKKIPEFRIFQEFNYKQKFHRFILHHRIRLEERFIEQTSDEHLIESNNLRCRSKYRLQVTVPILKSEKEQGYLAFHVRDEVFFNGISSTPFEQNRLHFVIAFQPFTNLALEIGYMNIYINEESLDNSLNVARFTIRHFLEI